MKTDMDEVKLTAYALGELDPAEAAEVEARLASHPASRQQVEETRRLAGILTRELKAEAAPGLPGEMKDAIAAKAGGAVVLKRRSALKWAVNIAAGLLILGIVAGMLLPSFSRAREQARRTSSAQWVLDQRSPVQNLRAVAMLYPQPETQVCLLVLPSKEPLPDAFFLGAKREDRFDADPQASLRPPSAPGNTESYEEIVENDFISVSADPRSTFSIDVDTASYSNVRRFLTQYQRPPKSAVRIEELINYFTYDYAPPTDQHPFAARVEVSACPWNMKHRLVKIGLKGKEVTNDERAPSNLVFLLDVSGSMTPANKLPLVREAMKLLVSQLTDKDRVAIAVYAGAAGLVLDSTPCTDRQKIMDALDRLQAGGSTAGGAGIQLAYRIAEANFIKGGVNRIILCTDGDFNVGVSDKGSLTDLVREKAKSGVFLSVFGFGMGNLKDSTLESLADKGNGNYGYIDTLREAKKALVEQLSGTLVTIAKDVKIQIEFNPARVAAFRQVGYENRKLAHQDFNDDTKDAGEIGAGHTVTALYEIVPVGVEVTLPGVDPLKYQKPAQQPQGAENQELLTLKLRYKQPDGDTSALMETPVLDAGLGLGQATPDFKFASSVAMFGMILRDSKYKNNATMDGVIELAGEGLAKDPGGYRAEFVQLAKAAKAVMK